MPEDIYSAVAIFGNQYKKYLRPRAMMTLPIPPRSNAKRSGVSRLITVSQAIRCVLFIYMVLLSRAVWAVNSDIDLLVTICQPLTETQRATLMQNAGAFISAGGVSRKTRSGGHCRAYFPQLVPRVFSTFPGNAI